MVSSEVVFKLEEPGSELAQELLHRYYEELASRFPEGFDPEQSVGAPAAELAPPHGAFLVAWWDGRAVGCGAVRTLSPITAEIKRMWIDPAVRGRGIAKRLLMELEARAHRLGCRVVRLDTNAELTEALRLYRSAGYCDIPAYNDNQYAAHWFEKCLT